MNIRQCVHALGWAAAALFMACPAAFAAPAAPTKPVTDVDVLLVVAMDVSGSVDFQEAELQRKGLSEAFASKEVVQAIRSGSLGRIAVSVVRFSSRSYGVMSVPVIWHVVSDQKSGAALSQEIAGFTYETGRGTSISDAIDLSVRLFDRTTDFRAQKRVIDVSGDGANNAGRPVLMARDEALAKGIVINGLPILEEPSMPDLDAYYKGCVIGGPGSFILVAKNFQDFAQAIRRKLILEISGLTPKDMPERPMLMRTAGAPEPKLSRPYQRPPMTNVPYPGGCDFPMFGGFGGYNFR